MARISPSFTLSTTTAPPSVSSESRFSMVLARISSTFSWRRRSRVSITLSPGWGSSVSPVLELVYQYSLITRPEVSSSCTRVPDSPRR